jgi:hypothetical protein
MVHNYPILKSTHSSARALFEISQKQQGHMRFLLGRFEQQSRPEDISPLGFDFGLQTCPSYGFISIAFASYETSQEKQEDIHRCFHDFEQQRKPEDTCRRLNSFLDSKHRKARNSFR